MNFSEVSLLIVIAAIFGIIAKFLRQPILIGFLFSGFALSLMGLLSDHHLLDNLGKIGVTLLLFLVGLEMNFKDIKSVGKTALATGIGQIVFTSVVGFLISTLLGFSVISSIYIAVALTFSSTIIIVKLLSEKDDVNSLYGKISVGFLLVQDFVAILILLFLAGLKEGDFGIAQFAILSLKSIALFASVWYLSKSILPKLFFKLVGDSQELMFIVSIAWALGIASLVGGPLKFSFEIGGFLAGLALSSVPDSINISSKTKSLRDFFLTIFFISLGGQLVVGNLNEILGSSIIFSLFVLIGNPLIVMLIMGVLGHKSRTSFLASVTVAQISEFSFILMSMGKSLGHISDSELSMIVLVGAITMTGSTYLILGSDKLYLKLKNLLKIFERKNTTEVISSNEQDLSDHVVLVGCDKIGSSIVNFLRKREHPFVVVDFNPSIFDHLTSENINVLLGDITDNEIFNLTKIDKAKLVISTVPNLTENLFLVRSIKNLKEKPIFIASSNNKQDTIKLYEEGVDYVLNPDLIAGEFLRHIFKNYGLGSTRISKIGKAHFNRLLMAKSYRE